MRTRPMMNGGGQNKRGIVVVAAILAVVAALLISRGFSPSPVANYDAHIARVTKGDFEIKVKMVGELDAARTHMVSSAIRGDKGKIIFLVEDGSVVETDDVLVRLDPTPFETEVNRLSGEVQGLEAGVESAGQGLEWEKNQAERQSRTAEYDLKVAELELRRILEGDGPLQLAQYENELGKVKEEYDRYLAYISDLEELRTQGFSNLTELTLARQRAEELEEQYRNARQRHESYKSHVLPTLVETARAKVNKAGIEIQQGKKGAAFKVARAASALAEVEGKLETARALLDTSLDELKKTTIRAPFGGIAILYETFRDGKKRKPRVGDRVWQNQPLLYLPDISAMIVKTRVREVDLHKVAVGKACSIRVDAYPDTVFSGAVTTIGMLASERFENGIGEKYFQLVVTLAGENQRLRPGMTARITISSDKASRVLFVPLHAVFTDGAETYCYLVEENKKYRRRTVNTGRQNEDLVEIVSGLKEGDLISLLKPAPEQLIRARP